MSDKINEVNNKIKECDSKINQLKPGDSRLEELYRQREEYEKEADQLIREQFDKEQEQFNKQLSNYATIAESTQEIEAGITEQLKISKFWLRNIKEISNALADYSVNIDEAELDEELQELYEEINDLDNPWYL